MNKQNSIIPVEVIENKIYFIRGQKVMLDRDIAELYDVQTRVLNQAVKRNILRFPEDFMFQLTKEEFEDWKSQIVTSNKERMGLRKLPLAFTEQGIAMLSGILKSERAILVNIQIIRTFTKLRRMVAESDYLRRRLEVMEKQYDEQFKIVFEAIRRLLIEEKSSQAEIVFKK